MPVNPGRLNHVELVEIGEQRIIRRIHAAIPEATLLKTAASDSILASSPACTLRWINSAGGNFAHGVPRESPP
jgi:hypothetical protein